MYKWFIDEYYTCQDISNDTKSFFKLLDGFQNAKVADSQWPSVCLKISVVVVVVVVVVFMA